MTQTAIESTITRAFRIPEQNMDYLEEQIAQLNKRAKRLHCSQIILETLSTETIENDKGDVSLYFHVQISGEAPRINGWTFIAVLEHLYNEDCDNLVHAVPEMLQEGELANYRHAVPYCEHCKTQRLRNNTYILKSNDNGTYKQVGRQCLVDFLGHDDPMAVAYSAQFIAEACEAAEECLDDDFSFGSPSKKLSTEYFLSWVHASIRHTGWCARKDAGYGKVSTADDAMYCMDKYKMFPSTYENSKPTEQDKETAKKALEWIREGDWNTASDFLYSLYIVCKSNILDRRHTGIAAALFVAYNRAMEAERERQQAATTSEWQGEVGEKTIFTLKCDSVFYQENYYGRRASTTSIYKLSDENGNRFTWFSSNDCLEVGNTYTLKGTIKAHDTYKDVKQTVLTRCKVQ